MKNQDTQSHDPQGYSWSKQGTAPLQDQKFFGSSSNSVQRQREAQPLEEASSWLPSGPVRHTQIHVEKYRAKRNHHGALIWILLIAFLIVFTGGTVTAIRMMRIGLTSHLQPTHTFQVGPHPVVTIHNSTGAIRIHSQSNNVVSVTATIESSLLGSDPSIAYEHPDQNHINVSASSSPWNFLGVNPVDFDITVPKAVDLVLRTNVGDINITGVHGQLSLQNSTGTISLSQVNLMGTGRLQTEAGSITFTGAISANANYQFEDNIGSIRVTLPTDSTFNVNARSNTGSIISDFSDVQIKSKNSVGVGASAQGSVGGNKSSTTISLHTNTGSISLLQGSSE